MRVAVVFVGLAIVAMMAVMGIQTALAGAGDREVIDGESFNPSAGSYQSLDRSNLANTYYNDSVSVTDENGDRSFEGRDYEWNATDGTIKPIVGGNLDGDSTATIDYDYRRTTERQRELAALTSQIPSSIGLILPLGFVLAAFAALRGL